MVWIQILQLLTSFSLLILIHEFGHFLFAKIFGARVDKFYLFFDPWFSIFKFKIGDTTYGMGWVPVGGYCKIAGMVDESTDKEQKEALKNEPQSWEYRSKPAWKRLLIIVGGVMMNILLAIGIYIGMTYAWGDAYIKASDVKDGFEYSELAQDMGFRNGDKILSIEGRPVDNYLSVPKSLLLDEVQEITVEREGKSVDIPIEHSRYIKKLLKEQHFLHPRFPFVVGEVLSDSSAARAGLMAGDSLVAVDSVPMRWTDEFRTAFQAHRSDTAWVSFVRAGQPMTLPVVVAESGSIGVQLKEVNISDYYTVSTRQYTFFEAIPVGFVRTFTSVGDYFKQLRLIASPETEAYKSVGGLIAMGKIFPSEWNWLSFWQITALLSIMLAVLNILPIPLLDGGHVVFILYEMITGRKPSDKVMEWAVTIGMVLVFGIIILANGNDILKLIFG